MREQACRCGVAFGLSLGIALAAAGVASAAERALWLRYPAISPDGQTVAFSYRGNLWKVPAAGGTATPLTVSEALQHDAGVVAGRQRDRVRLGPLRQLRRLRDAGRGRRGQAADLPLGRRDADELHARRQGGAVQRGASSTAATNVQFPDRRAARALPGRASTAACPSRCSPRRRSTPSTTAAGKRLAYSDQKGYEMEWRKHDNSVVRPRRLALGRGQRQAHAAHRLRVRTTASRCGRPTRSRSTTSPSGAARSTCGGSTSPTRSTRCR